MPIGRPLNSGRSCCSTEAKYEFRSRKSHSTVGAEPSVNGGRSLTGSDCNAMANKKRT
jgi:hypothetical protein